MIGLIERANKYCRRGRFQNWNENHACIGCRLPPDTQAKGPPQSADWRLAWGGWRISRASRRLVSAMRPTRTHWTNCRST